MIDKINIIFLDENTVTLGDIDFSALGKLGEYRSYENFDEDDILQKAKDAHILIANKSPITRKVMSNLPELKLVTIVATGFNNVDTKAAGEKNIRVCNVPGYATDSVAQHTFALILNLATKAYLYNSDIKNGRWQQSKSFHLMSYPAFELAGKTIGIIGYGAIGRKVAKIAEAFAMKVLVLDAYGIKDGKYPNTELDKLLPEADIVTLHCPLTDESRRMIDEKALGKMKKTAFLINTARGSLVDENALRKALDNGDIAGAGLDVLSEEPPREGNVLLQARNIFLTAHNAWTTVQARQRLIEETVENIKAFLNGKPRNVVV